MENIFPMSFFGVMEHLPVHLAEEALIAGAVQFRWMYLLTLKRYVSNHARPEASIAKGYLMEECMNFCTLYLNTMETKLNRPACSDDGGRPACSDDDRGSDFGRSITKGVKTRLDDVTLTQAHRYVLVNTDTVILFQK
ncbi:hypothetical protein GBA52_024531 [Prunus armeniaca]|nr:hypothetical protein GBA52_024531 [Prunus armeniaca]